MAENLSRVEDILDATIDGTEYTDRPLSRVEQKLLELKQMISEGISPADTATIRQAVTDYLATHPIEGVDESTVNALIADYIDEHPIDAGTSDIWKAQGELGAKNLLVYPYNTNSYSGGGVSFIVNEDGSVIVSGTTTNEVQYSIYDLAGKQLSLKAGTYIYTDGVAGNNSVYCNFLVRDTANNNNTLLNPQSGAPFTITDEMESKIASGQYKIQIKLCVRANKPVDNLTFYPMLRYASDTDSTWQPYAKTNKQLTDEVKALAPLNGLSVKNGTGTNSIVAGDTTNNIASAIYAHAEGNWSRATGNASHAEGTSTKAIGPNSHAEGTSTEASVAGAHAEGQNTKAGGVNSHAEGQGTSATGATSHAEGGTTQAKGNFSHSQNYGTSAKGFCQTVIGAYNEEQGNLTTKTATDYAFIIGNGTDADHRSNALAVKWDGTIVFQDGSEMNTAPTGGNGGDSAELESILTNYAKRGAAVNLVNFNLAFGYFDGLEKNDTTAGVEYYVIASNHFGDYETGDYGAIFISATNNVAAAASRFYLANSTWDTLPVGHYKLISAYEIPNPGVRLAVARVDSNVETVLATYDNQSDGSVEFAITANGNNNFARIRVYIEVDSGAEISGQEIFPVIVPAAIDIDVATPNMYVANNSKLTGDSVEYRSRINNHESRIQSLEQNGGSGSGGSESPNPLVTYASSHFTNKKAVAFGTSITSNAKNNSNGYVTLVKNALGLSVYDNKGSFGNPFALGNVNGYGNGIGYTIEHTDVSTYDLVTIEGGTNDFKLGIPLGTVGNMGDTGFNKNTMCGALRSAIEYILAHNKTAEIVLILDPQRNNGGFDVNTVNSDGHTMLDYINAMTEIANLYGIKVCDWYRLSGINALNLDRFTSDGLHPTDKGYARLAWVLYCVLTSALSTVIVSEQSSSGEEPTPEPEPTPTPVTEDLPSTMSITTTGGATYSVTNIPSGTRYLALVDYGQYGFKMYASEYPFAVTNNSKKQFLYKSGTKRVEVDNNVFDFASESVETAVTASSYCVLPSSEGGNYYRTNGSSTMNLSMYVYTSSDMYYYGSDGTIGDVAVTATT